MSKNVTTEEKEWQMESDVRTLKDAIEIFNDPKRLSAAKKMAAKQKSMLDAVGEIDKDFLTKIGMGK